MKKEKISIIVPVYKVPEKFLNQCINSCINQTYDNIEILLVDDGSPDECGRICDFYSKKDKRIKVIHQMNKGLSGARNTGVNNSTGEWILFVDGDDYLETNCCEILINQAKSDIDVICFDSIRDENGSKKQIKSKLVSNNLYIGENKALQLLTLDFNSHISTAWGKLYNKKFLIDNNIMHNEELRQGAEGIEFCIRLFGKTKKVLYINKYLYNYNYNENSISSIPSDKNNELVIKCFEAISSEINIDDYDYKSWFYNRLKYFVVTTFLRNIFNPSNKMRFIERKNKAKAFTNIEIIDNTINWKNNGLDGKRKLIMIFIKLKLYRLIYLMAFLNNKRLKG